MSSEQRVRKAFLDQAKWCDALGSPLTARICRVTERSLDPSSTLGQRVFGWTGDPDAMADSVPLRLAGGIHALVRAGHLPNLTAYYAPQGSPLDARFDAAIAEGLSSAQDPLMPWLDRTPQTNEVARSGALYPGLMQIAAEFALPLKLFEVGASGGLNLLADHYAYDLGGRTAGTPGSPVSISPDWTGPAPQGPDPKITCRRGCDLAPVDLRKDEDRARMMAYIWPDQPQRLARAAGALQVFDRNPVQLDQGDALAWVHHQISEPVQGAACVLMHSIAFQYFPPETQQGIAAHMRAVGARATPEAPLAWLAFEQQPGDKGPGLTLTTWPGGTHLLAEGDAHVRRLDWKS